MNCIQCPKEAKIRHFNGHYCNDCFLEMLVKRVKKEVRNEAKFNKDEKVLVYGDLAKYFLEKAVEDLPLEITETEKELDHSEYDKIVIPWTADDEASLFYEELTSEKPNFDKIGQSKVVKLFKTVLDKELIDAAKILNLKFEPKPKNKDVEKIHQKYPTSKFGLVKSAAEIKKALK